MFRQNRNESGIMRSIWIAKRCTKVSYKNWCDIRIVIIATDYDNQ